MEGRKACLVVLCFIALNLQISDAVICYTCDHVAHPRDCDRVMECPAGTTCHVTSYVQPDGHAYYKSGCLQSDACPTGSAAMGRRDTRLCNRCCNTNYCNKELCDGSAPASTTHGLRCLKCDSVEDPTHCGAVTECPAGQVCLTELKYVFGEKRFELGCAPQRCQSTPSLQATPCTQCCMTENCNREQCHNTGPIPAALTTARPVTDVQTVHGQTTQARTTVSHTMPHFTAAPIQHGCHYKGHVYNTSAKWTDGCDFSCACLDGDTGRYSCTDRCPTYSALPTGCNLVKPPGECCAKPDCLHAGMNSTTTFGCFSNGTMHAQDDSWQVGCDYECQCLDAVKGFYRCSTLCWKWTLPSVCTLLDPAPGKCCPTPKCPTYVIIQYPPGYVEN